MADLDSLDWPVPALASLALHPALVTTAGDLYDGYLLASHEVITLWVSETETVTVDRVYADAADADRCWDCSAYCLPGLITNTCHEDFCPGCWRDFPRQCHPQCFGED
jgi:hypothetical protein